MRKVVTGCPISSGINGQGCREIRLCTSETRAKCISKGYCSKGIGFDSHFLISDCAKILGVPPEILRSMNENLYHTSGFLDEIREVVKQSFVKNFEKCSYRKLAIMDI